MILDIFETKLKQSLGLVEGETLFRGTIPSDVTRAVMMRRPLAGVKIDPYLPGYYKNTGLQVIVRDTDPAAGDALARQIQKALNVSSRERYPATATRGALHLDLVYPDTLPIQYPTLTGNTIEWSWMMLVTFGVQD